MAFLLFLIPFGIWCFLFQPILSGRALISSETLHIYSVVKFYIDNLKLGVFPLWEPFVLWGEPTQIFFNYAGIFNPLWLLTGILSVCGLSFYQAFIFSLSAYFWIGLWGFYLLAEIVLNDRRAAYFAFLLLLFSSVSMSMFAQFHPPLLYVPSIWFFYFLFSFFRHPSCKALAGLALTVGIILTSYLPFYFLTVLIIAMSATLIFYFSEFRKAVPHVVRFLRAQVVLAVLALSVMALSFVPGYLAYRSTVNKDVVAPFRSGNVEKRTGVDFTDYDKTAQNGFTSRMDLEDLYSNFDLVQYGDDCFFYVSLFLYVVLMVGASLRISRVMAVCGLMALPLFFLIMSSGAGFHRFVFEYVPYFKLIRNMHFFLPFFIAVLVLMTAEQMRKFILYRTVLSEKYRPAFLLWIVLIHVGIILFLSKHSYVPGSSYMTLGFSFVFWIIFLFGQKYKNGIVLAVLLFLSVIIQPLEVIDGHNQKSLFASDYINKALIEDCIRAPSAKPVFSYARPVSDREIGNDDTAYSRITMTDASRFYDVGFPTFWSYDLTLKAPFAMLQNYTRYKFYVYGGDEVAKSGTDFKAALAIKGPSGQFAVTAFDVNSVRIRTNFAEEKLLVYNDSYHKDWKVFVNGRAAEVLRTNVAFKGVHLPAGATEVIFRYAPKGIVVLSLMLSIVLLLTLGALLWFAVKERKTAAMPEVSL